MKNPTPIEVGPVLDVGDEEEVTTTKVLVDLEDRRVLVVTVRPSRVEFSSHHLHEALATLSPSDCEELFFSILVGES